MPRVYIKKRQTKYSLQDLCNAVKDVKEKKKTYRQAQDTYNVPIKVIYDRIKGRKIDAGRMGAGVKRVLSERVEEYIVSCLKARAQMGHPCQKEELKLLVKEYVDSKQLKTPFKDNKPGDDWYLNFMKRYPELSLKKPEHLQKARKDARKSFIVYDFYDMLKRVIQENYLESKPEYIYNCDESGFQSDPSRMRGIGEKGKPLTRVSGGSGRESTTVLACVSADGQVLPPLIVFKGAAVQARWTSENSYPGTLYAATKNGWMEEPVFYNWLAKSFIPHVNKLREDRNEMNQKALLIYDGHASHISVRIIEEAETANVVLLKFPSHLTDRIQPLDKCVFGPVKKTWDKKLVEHGVKQMGKGTGRLSRAQFSELLHEVYIESLKSENIISGFTTTGMYPVDPSKFPKHLFQGEDLALYANLLNNNKPEKPANCDRHHTEKEINEQHAEYPKVIEINVDQPYPPHNNEKDLGEVSNTFNNSDASLGKATIFGNLKEKQSCSQEAIDAKEVDGNHGQKIVVNQTKHHRTDETVNPSTSSIDERMIEEDTNVPPLISQILKVISLDTQTPEDLKKKN